MDDKLKLNFEKVLSKDKRYLLGLSGGADSMALFYALIQYDYNFEVCTIDHACREAISHEIKELRKVCKEEGIVFHTKKVENVLPDASNLEDRFRQERYALFEKIYNEIGFDALLLGHHADDQIETVLKRVLEGASISALQGIKESKHIGKMLVIRPLLTVRKKEIVSWLSSQNKTWFEDETNKDCKYLRARMREKILPGLTQEFGKEFGQNLLHFSEKMRKIDEYFAKKSLESIKGPFGSYYPFEKELDHLEAEFFLRKICELEGFNPSREEINRFCKAIELQENGIELSRKNKKIVLERKGIFSLFDGEYIWKAEPEDCALKGGGWQALFTGKIGLALDFKEIEFRLPSSLNEKLPSGVSLKKWYVKFGVPAHMRISTPVVYEGDRLIGEVLTGNMHACGEEKWVLTFMRKKNTIASHLAR